MKFKILNKKSKAKRRQKKGVSLKKESLYNYLVFSLIIILGAFLRLYNLNWDKGHFFHPDERNIAAAVSRIHFFDQLNPDFFAYGSFPIYLYRAAGELLVAVSQNHAWVYEWDNINLIGRAISAFLSSLTIILVFLVTRKITNEKTALLSSFLVAFCPSLIQTAHFGVTESMIVFWLFLILFFSLKIAEKPSIGNYLKIGVVLGLAIATKASSLSFYTIPFAVNILYHLKNLKCHLKFLFSLAISISTFSLFSPYAFLAKQKFLESMNYETGVATGRLKVVYVLQFEKTLPYLFQIKNFFWQMGPVALLGIIGTLVLLISALKNRQKKLLTLLVFPLIYFFYIGSFYTKFIRYMVPVLPFLAIFAASTIMIIWERYKKLGAILIIFTEIATFLWSFGFFSIYTRESTRISASSWIYQNIPKGAKILTEHWDDGLPIDLNPYHPDQYKSEQLTIYEPDNNQKINYYAEKLSSADYLILSSRRLYGTLMYLPEKYPITSRYYKLLFSGELGYEKIAEFSSYPAIFGVTINDDSSEETFQVYDHPRVLIFRNEKRLPQELLIQKISYGKN